MTTVEQARELARFLTPLLRGAACGGSSSAEAAPPQPGPPQPGPPTDATGPDVDLALRLENVAIRYVRAIHGGLPNVPMVYEDVFRWLNEESIQLRFRTPPRELSASISPPTVEPARRHTWTGATTRRHSTMTRGYGTWRTWSPSA
jgi:hypothetical protein